MLDEKIADLEKQGYATQSFIIPASGVGAWHQRKRVWLLAYSTSIRRERRETQLRSISEKDYKGNANESKRTNNLFVPNANQINGNRRRHEPGINFIQEQREILGSEYWNTEPDVDRLANGLPDQLAMLEGFGNAVVPQIPYIILKYIVEIESKIDSGEIEM